MYRKPKSVINWDAVGTINKLRGRDARHPGFIADCIWAITLTRPLIQPE